MTGEQFRVFRKDLRLSLRKMGDILGYKSKQALNYQEGLDDVSFVMEAFFNYTQRYGFEEAKSEFSKRFK